MGFICGGLSLSVFKNQLKAPSKYSSAKVVQLGASFIYLDEYRVTSRVFTILLTGLSFSVLIRGSSEILQKSSGSL